jgi:hypothetical protein
MTPLASRIFDLSARRSECLIVRHEFEDPTFEDFRAALRELVKLLGADSNWADVAEPLRHLLMSALTRPQRYLEMDVDALRALRDPQAVSERWGRDAQCVYLRAAAAYERLALSENPLRLFLEAELNRLVAVGRRVRIHCPRRDVKAYQDLASMRAPDDGRLGFIHSARDYREADPFDVLIKVGPLKAEGYSSLPPGVLTAPRFDRVLQFVWGGLRDDPGVWIDPVLAATSSKQCLPRWRTLEVIHGDRTPTELPGDGRDDLVLVDRRAVGDRIQAVRIELSQGCALLRPPRAQLFVIDRADGTPARVEARIAAEYGYVALPRLNDAEFVVAQAARGHYAPLWKSRLGSLSKSARRTLIQELRLAGVDLVGLPACLREWARSATSVIHAPMKAAHFQALIRCLGIEHDSVTYPRPPATQWWRLAWREVKHSRSAAIDAGLHEHELLADEILTALEEAQSMLRSRVASGSMFTLRLPEERGLDGVIDCYPVEYVEFGYRAPDPVVRSVLSSSQADEWRG